MAMSCIVLAEPATAPRFPPHPRRRPCTGEGSLITQCLPVWRSTLQTGLVNHHPWETGLETV